MRPTYKIIIILVVILATAVLVQYLRNMNESTLFSIRQPSLAAPGIPMQHVKFSDGYVKVLILASEEKVSYLLLDQLKRLFFQTKTNYFIVNINDNALKAKLDRLGSQDIVLVTAEVIRNPSAVQCFKDYVESGGRLVFLFRGFNRDLLALQGIKQVKGYRDNNRGIKFESRFFPGMDTVEIKDKPFINSSLDVELQPKCEVIARSMDEIPLLWLNPVGKGRVLFFNTTNGFDKINRGFLLQGIACVTDVFLSTILNARILNIDDFPAPISKINSPVIFPQYHMSNEMFYKTIWWSSVYSLIYKYNLKITTLLIGAYNNNTGSNLPDINPQDAATLLYFARKIAECQGEIGIHGYNHMPLALSGELDIDRYGYRPWQSTANMEGSLLLLQDELHRLLGNLRYYTYVPPSNIISVEGKKIVGKVFPDMHTINSVFAGDAPGVLYQEFGRDPVLPGIYNLPRLSSGYDYNPGVMWEIYNGIAWFGVFNHFIHPDDILDPVRSQGRTWKQLFGSFSNLIADVHKHFGFLRSVTDADAYRIYKEYEGLQVFCHLQEGEMEIRYKNAVPPVFHYLRLHGQKVSRVVNGDFILIDRIGNNHYYMLKGNSNVIKVLVKAL